jgi:hypothetical protein
MCFQPLFLLAAMVGLGDQPPQRRAVVVVAQPGQMVRAGMEEATPLR